MERKKYPLGPEHYALYEEVGQGVSASVHRALCIPLDEIVSIKILDFERDNSDLTMVLVDHPNVLKSHCSFVSNHNMWVVMPFMAGGSCLHILKAAYPGGLEETVIATVLRDVLKGLEYLHQNGHIHRDVKAGNILIGARGAIRLGDFCNDLINGQRARSMPSRQSTSAATSISPCTVSCHVSTCSTIQCPTITNFRDYA